MHFILVVYIAIALFPDSSPGFEAYCYAPKAAEEIHVLSVNVYVLDRKKNGRGGIRTHAIEMTGA